MIPTNERKTEPKLLLLNACTDQKTPLLVKNVPKIVSRNVRITKNMFQIFNVPFRSCTIVEWINAVAVNQGKKDAFSTGSQLQYPPHPSTSYDQRAPYNIPMLSNNQVIKLH